MVFMLFFADTLPRRETAVYQSSTTVTTDHVMFDYVYLRNIGKEFVIFISFRKIQTLLPSASICF